MHHEIRKLINLVESASLSEAVVYRDSQYVVLKDPSVGEFNRVYAMVNDSHGEGMRALINGASLYTWDGYYANHDEIENLLGLHGSLSLHLWRAYPELDISDLADDVNDGDELKRRILRMCETVRSNVELRKLYGADYDIKLDDGTRDFWASSINE